MAARSVIGKRPRARIRCQWMEARRRSRVRGTAGRRSSRSSPSWPSLPTWSCASVSAPLRRRRASRFSSTLAIGGLPLLYDLLRKLLKREFGSDLLGGISIVTSVLLGEYLAGSIIVLMLSGGEALESYAVRSASSVLAALAKRMPSVAHRKRDAEIVDVAAAGRRRRRHARHLSARDLPGGRRRDRRARRDGRVVPDRRAVPDHQDPRLDGDLGGDQRRVRPDDPDDQARRRLALRQDHAGDARVRGSAAAAAPAGRPAGRDLHAGRAGGRARRLGGQRRSGPVPRGAGRRHAVPAADRDPGRDHRLDLARAPAGRSSSRTRSCSSRSPSAARRSSTRPARSPTASRADRTGDRPGLHAGGGADPGGQPGALLEAPARRARSSPRRRPSGCDLPEASEVSEPPGRGPARNGRRAIRSGHQPEASSTAQQHAGRRRSSRRRPAGWSASCRSTSATPRRSGSATRPAPRAARSSRHLGPQAPLHSAS